MAKDMIETLNDLVKLDIDAVGAYESAINACKIEEIRTRLGTFRDDHQRHVQDLSAMVQELGGAPPTKPDVKGFVIKGFTEITSQGDRSALMAMQGNEVLTNRLYASALESKDLTAAARALVARNHEDEKRHLAWIRDALKSRAWEKSERRVA